MNGGDLQDTVILKDPLNQCIVVWLSVKVELVSFESMATLPPFDPIEGHKWFFSRFPASLSAKSSFYLPAFEISRSCRTASEQNSLLGRPNKTSLELFW